MTRKHFIALADALRAHEADMGLILAVADICAADNSNFNRTRFIDAATGA